MVSAGYGNFSRPEFLKERSHIPLTCPENLVETSGCSDKVVLGTTVSEDVMLNGVQVRLDRFIVNSPKYKSGFRVWTSAGAQQLGAGYTRAAFVYGFLTESYGMTTREIGFILRNLKFAPVLQ